MADDPRRAELRELLTRARARLQPEDFGLRGGLRRRVPGLRREEVAELAGVSLKWYAQFEIGAASVSTRTLKRIAGALRLSRAQSADLLRLARPELGRIFVSERNASDALDQLATIRRTMRRLNAASSFAELAAAAADICARIERHDVTFVAQAAPESNDGVIGHTFLSFSGARGMEMAAVVKSDRCRPSERPHAFSVASGQTAFVADMMTVGASEAARAQERSTRSWAAAPFVVGDRRYAVGCANFTIYEPTATMIAELELLATICEIVARS